MIFIHGFISSSKFWTETLFPNFSRSIKSKYRLFAIDLLGFGKSPKPHDSLYTVKEHLDMIEKTVLEPNKLQSFHIVAHSLGCILGLALAVKYPNSVKSLTLLAPVIYHTTFLLHFIFLYIFLTMVFDLLVSALFSDTKRGGANSIYDAKGGPTSSVATDRIWSIDGLLVRAC